MNATTCAPMEMLHYRKNLIKNIMVNAEGESSKHSFICDQRLTRGHVTRSSEYNFTSAILRKKCRFHTIARSVP